jgi:hypothetical protein
MAYGPFKNLNGGSVGDVLPTTTGSAIYTSPANKAVEVASVILHNAHTAAELVEVFIGGTANTANRILRVSVPAGETFEFAPKIPIVLHAASGGVAIYAKTTGATRVTMWLTGREDS